MNRHRALEIWCPLLYNDLINKEPMKLLLKFLFQIPLLSFLVIGVYSVVGDNHLISALVGIFVLFLYTTGDYLDGAKDD